MFGIEGEENLVSHDSDLAGSGRLLTVKPIWAKLGQVPNVLQGHWSNGEAVAQRVRGFILPTAQPERDRDF